MEESLRIQGIQQQTQQTLQHIRQNDTAGDFQSVLEQTTSVSFSNHAQKRLEIRSIELDDAKLNRLENAVDKAEAHGGKESLILMDDLAFIVNVQKRMVVTTMDVNQRKDGVFTQIDSVVIAENEA